MTLVAGDAYRIMKRDVDGRPLAGGSKFELGVRYNCDFPDVHLDAQQMVLIEERGMCASPRPEDLPPSLLSKVQSPDGQGRSRRYAVYRMSVPALPLTLEAISPANRDKIVIRPRASMHIRIFMGHLASTGPQWAEEAGSL